MSEYNNARQSAIIRNIGLAVGNQPTESTYDDYLLLLQNGDTTTFPPDDLLAITTMVPVGIATVRKDILDAALDAIIGIIDREESAPPSPAYVDAMFWLINRDLAVAHMNCAQAQTTPLQAANAFDLSIRQDALPLAENIAKFVEFGDEANNRHALARLFTLAEYVLQIVDRGQTPFIYPQLATSYTNSPDHAKGTDGLPSVFDVAIIRGGILPAEAAFVKILDDTVPNKLLDIDPDINIIDLTGLGPEALMGAIIDATQQLHDAANNQVYRDQPRQGPAAAVTHYTFLEDYIRL